MKYRVIFMGTPEFAVPALKRLIADEEVVMVITQQDKPQGRGYNLKPPPIKVVAQEANICVRQPNTLKDEALQQEIRELKPDLIVVAAYGKILPEAVLNIPQVGCVNIHASLLPKYRGAAPINRTIMNGETTGGITIMYMAKGIDTGDIILQRPIDIPETMTVGEYHDIMSVIGADALAEAIASFKNGTATRTKQDDSKATYAAKLEKSECEIDFTKTEDEVVNQIRGLSPCPGAFTIINGKRFKLFGAVKAGGKGNPGDVLQADCGCFEIACGKGSVIICDVQQEGCRLMSAKEFFAGRKI